MLLSYIVNEYVRVPAYFPLLRQLADDPIIFGYYFNTVTRKYEKRLEIKQHLKPPIFIYHSRYTLCSLCIFLSLFILPSITSILRLHTPDQFTALI